MNIDAAFWIAVSFFIFLGVLVYLRVPQKINILINKKIKETKNELEEAEKLKDEAKNLLSDYESKLNHATKETTDIIDTAKKESEENIINSTERFHQLIDIKKKILNQKIHQINENAIREAKNYSIKISIQAAEKIIKNSIDKKKLDRIYNESLNQAKISLKKTIP